MTKTTLVLIVHVSRALVGGVAVLIGVSRERGSDEGGKFADVQLEAQKEDGNEIGGPTVVGSSSKVLDVLTVGLDGGLPE